MTTSWQLFRRLWRGNHMIINNYFCWLMMPRMPKRQLKQNWRNLRTKSSLLMNWEASSWKRREVSWSWKSLFPEIKQLNKTKPSRSQPILTCSPQKESPTFKSSSLLTTKMLIESSKKSQGSLMQTRSSRSSRLKT